MVITNDVWQSRGDRRVQQDAILQELSQEPLLQGKKLFC